MWQSWKGRVVAAVPKREALQYTMCATAVSIQTNVDLGHLDLTLPMLSMLFNLTLPTIPFHPPPPNGWCEGQDVILDMTHGMPACRSPIPLMAKSTPFLDMPVAGNNDVGLGMGFISFPTGLILQPSGQVGEGVRVWAMGA